MGDSGEIPSDQDVTVVSAVQPLHIAFLHNKFKKRTEDQYIVDVIHALRSEGHTVTIYASEIESDSYITQLQGDVGIKVLFCAAWLPPRWKFLRAMVMALSLAFFPPEHKPTLVMMDVNGIALYLLGRFSNYRLFYIKHFSALKFSEVYTQAVKVIPDYFTSRAMSYAHEIIVQSETLAGVFKRSFPHVRRQVRILHPCVDTGLWRQDTVNVNTVIPSLTEKSLLFVCLGSFRVRSNLKLMLEAFGHLVAMCGPTARPLVHLAIADDCEIDDQKYCEELREQIKREEFAHQVSFLSHVPVPQKKALIRECVCVILPCKHDMFPEGVLAALGWRKAIIATRSGFPKDALRHRLTAILIEPEYELMAAAMFKVMTQLHVQRHLRRCGTDLFKKYYTNAVFTRKINGFVKQYADIQYSLEKLLGAQHKK